MSAKDAVKAREDAVLRPPKKPKAKKAEPVVIKEPKTVEVTEWP